jgi:hypothetical protein
MARVFQLMAISYPEVNDDLKTCEASFLITKEYDDDIDIEKYLDGAICKPREISICLKGNYCLLDKCIEPGVRYPLFYDKNNRKWIWPHYNDTPGVIGTLTALAVKYDELQEEWHSLHLPELADLQEPFDEYLDANFDDFKLGSLNYSPSKVLKNTDPIGYKDMFLKWTYTQLDELKAEIESLEKQFDDYL